MQVSMWDKQFQDRKDDNTETERNYSNVKMMAEMVRNTHLLTCQKTEEGINTNRGTYTEKTLIMKEVCTQIVLK